MSAHSAGENTATLLVMVTVMKGGGRAPPPLPARANFTLMIECTPESSGYYSVYSVVLPRTKGGGVHTRRGVGGGGGSIFWKTPDIGLASYSIISLRYALYIFLLVYI